MPIKVALLWHMHQPNYQEPQSRRLVLPWVRLHALKDYLDMPLLAAEQENVRVTFNLVPALLDQLQLYVDGGVDRHFELSRIPADQLSDELRREILGTFFAGHTATLMPNGQVLVVGGASRQARQRNRADSASRGGIRYTSSGLASCTAWSIKTATRLERKPLPSRR